MQRIPIRTFAFIITFIIHIVSAQTGTHYGIKAGVVVSDFTITDKVPVNVGGQPLFLDYTDGASIHPTIALFGTMLVSDGLSVEAELSYLQKGAWKSHELTVYDQDNIARKFVISEENGFQYLQLDINAQPAFTVAGTSMYMTAGLSINYMVRIANFAADREKLTDLLLGYNAGAGFSLEPLLHSPLFIEAKYQGDFSEFYDPGNGKYWHRSVTLSIGIIL